MKPSQTRIDRGARYMKRFLASEDGQSFGDLGDDTKLLYIIGILICSDAGHISQEKLQEAVSDQDVRYAALLVAGRLGLMAAVASPDRYA